MRTSAILLCVVLGALAAHALREGVVGTITYEAERAFRNAKGDVSGCNLNGVKGKFSLLGGEDYTIFSVFAPEDNTYPVALYAFACEEESSIALDVQVNGIPAVSGEPLILEYNSTTHVLPLRRGLNTLTYTIHGGAVAMDAISIVGGSQPAGNGATLPYETVEAENATYTGTLIGPDRTYTTLPSEASQRLAVQISGNSYVDFTPKGAYNAIVIRFSIPNTQNGQGQAAVLSVSVNGKATTTLNVTSYYSWVYGNYPFSKNPGDGKPHHFYDDVRFFFGATPFPAGTPLRLVGATSGITYTIDLVEFYNVGPAFTSPAGYLSVVDSGADPSGNKDSYPGFNQAIANAVKQNVGVWIPPGRYVFSQRLTVNTVTIRGAGPWYTELHGNDFGFFGNWAPNPSTNVHLYDFAIFGQTRVRNDGEISSGAGGSYSSSTIQNVWIEHNKCGMWLDGPFDSLHITGVIIRNTFADGINFHKGVTNSVVEQSILRNVGDDALAMWPEQPNAYGSNTFQFNTLALPVLANLIAIYGGKDNSATDNYVVDNIVEGGGLQTGTRYNSVPLSGTTTFARNTLVRTGALDMYNPNSKGEGSIWLFSDSGPVTQGNIVFEDITIIDSFYSAIMFYQGQMTNLNFTNINVNGAVYLWEERQQGGAYAQGVVATGLTGAGTWICPNLANGFKITQGPGNNYPNTTVSGTC